MLESGEALSVSATKAPDMVDISVQTESVEAGILTIQSLVGSKSTTMLSFDSESMVDLDSNSLNLSELQNENIRLQEELQRLNIQLLSLQSFESEVAVLRLEKGTLENEAKVLRGQLDVNTVEMNALKERIHLQSTAEKNLRHKLSSSQLRRIDDQMSDVSYKNSKETEFKLLKDELDRTKQALDEQVVIRSTNEAALVEKTSLILALQEDILKLGNEVSEFKSHKESYQTILSKKAEELDRKQTLWQVERRELEERLHELLRYNADNATTVKELEAARKTRDKLERDLQALQASLEDTKNSLESALSDMKGEVQLSAAKNRELTSTIESMKDAAMLADIDLVSVKEKLLSKHLEVKSLESEVAGKSDEVGKLQKIIETLKSRNTQNEEDSVHVREQLQDEIRNLRMQLAEANGKIKLISGQLDAAKQDQSERISRDIGRESAKESQIGVLKDLMQDLKESRDIQLKLEEELRRKSNELLTVRLESDSMRQQLTEATTRSNRETKALNDQLAESRMELLNDRRLLLETQSQLESKVATVSNLTETVESLKVDNRSLKSKLEMLLIDVDTSSTKHASEMKGLTEELHRASDRERMLSERIQDLQQDIKVRGQELKQMKSAISAKNDDQSREASIIEKQLAQSTADSGLLADRIKVLSEALENASRKFNDTVDSMTKEYNQLKSETDVSTRQLRDILNQKIQELEHARSERAIAQQNARSASETLKLEQDARLASQRELEEFRISQQTVLSDERNSLEQIVKQSEERCHVMRTELKSVRESFAKKEDDWFKIRQSLEARVTTALVEKATMEQFHKSTIDTLKDEIASKIASLSELHQKYAILSQANVTLQANFSDKVQEMNEIRHALTAKDQHLVTLETKLRDALDNIKNIQLELEMERTKRVQCESSEKVFSERLSNLNELLASQEDLLKRKDHDYTSKVEKLYIELDSARLAVSAKEEEFERKLKEKAKKHSDFINSQISRFEAEKEALHVALEKTRTDMLSMTDSYTQMVEKLKVIRFLQHHIS
jgi:chromosome segregation ATPase